MTLPQNTPYFFALEILVLFVFLFGLVSNVHFWFKGSMGSSGRTSTASKTTSLVAGLARAFRRDALGAIILDWFFQRRLLRSSILAWVMHICFFWGVVILYFVGSLGLMLAEKSLLPVTKDTPWFAFVNDFAGAMVLFAVAVALYRRFVRRDWHLKTTLDDALLMGLLAVIVLSGFALEASRMLAERTSSDLARFAFVGYSVSAAFRFLSVDWPRAEITLWWTHVIGGMAFVAYLPYSKLMHLLAAPISVIASSVAPTAVRDVVEV